METQTKILVYGPVILQEGRLRVIKDRKDPFYKIPGGRIQKGETGEQCCLRELLEETGLEGIIKKELPSMHLDENPKTHATADITLHHYLVEITSSPIRRTPYFFGGHEVTWISTKNIHLRKKELAPNIWFLHEKGVLTQ